MLRPAVDGLAVTEIAVELAADWYARVLSELIIPLETDVKVPPDTRASTNKPEDPPDIDKVTFPETVIVPVPVVLAPFIVGSVTVPVAVVTAIPPPDATVDALAVGVAATDSRPAVNADTATTAMRCLIVFVDIYFLSLVRIRNFLNLARRSFDLLIPFPYGTHV